MTERPQQPIVQQYVLARVERLTRTEGSQTAGVGLKLRWSTGVEVEVTSKTLRDNCPCATCLEKRGNTSHSAPLAPRKSILKVLDGRGDELDLKEVWAVGNYALGMRWGDTHDSGIYSYNLLAALSHESSLAANG